jgi:hypothetical protein
LYFRRRTGTLRGIPRDPRGAHDLPRAGGDHVSAHPLFSFLAQKHVRFYTRMRSMSRRTLDRLEETDAASYNEEPDWMSLLDGDDDDH